MIVKPENMDTMSDDSSDIFLSEHEDEDVKEEEEEEEKEVDEEDEVSVVDVEDEKDATNIILQEERFVVTETMTTTQVCVPVKIDKSTQTRADEFPVKPTYADILANGQSNLKVTINNSSSGNKTISLPNSGTRKHITYDKLSTFTNNNSCTGRSENKKNNDTSSSAYADRTTISNDKSNKHSKKNDSGSYVRNPINNSNNNKSGSNGYKSWKKTRTYRNYRVQPYQRYNNDRYNNPYHNNRNNNNVWDRTPNNYYSRQDRHNRYGIRDSDNSYNSNSYYNSNNYNYNNQPKQWGLRTYTYQFKERLFHGFVQFMDFVFQYDYSRN